MNRLKPNHFVLERIQLQPITNAELNAAQEEMNRIKKIENPTFDDIKEGYVVLVDTPYNNHNIPYIVFDSMKLPDYFASEINAADRYTGNMLLIRYDDRDGKYCYRTSWAFKDNFPNSSTNAATITAIYNAKINTMEIKDCKCLKNESDAIHKKMQAMNNN